MVTPSGISVPLANPHPLARGLPPAWASEWGDDRYGFWCSFRVNGVVQRLRWIRPGRFVMGSPPEESGRHQNEGRRALRVMEGFWLFDTPCTQSLWEAVMGKNRNPSRFRSPTRPVEQVSWQDCLEFLENLNGLLDGLVLSFPSEAQWEYACRAGTTSTTYAGDLEIRGINHAPVLDGIAWYAGNCGVDFELDEGEDIMGWREKQYDLKEGGTHPVGRKAPNDWGLYDTLGNVLEWCQDEERMESDDPGGEAPASPGRMYRGGCWLSYAHDVRAAYRSAYDPGHRANYLGFRCGEFRAGQDE